MAVEREPGKAKAIDVILKEKGSGVAKFYNHDGLDSAAWPEGSPCTNHTNEEELYGYGDGAPTPKTPLTTSHVHRRSSLKSSGPRRASISYSGEMTLNLPLGKVTKKRRSIRFKDKSEVRDVEPVADMVDDPNRLWFQKDEYSHIQERIYAIIDGAKKGENSSLALETRGLEPLMGGASYYERKEAYDSVLEEQRVQKMQGKYDDEFIRTIYQFHTVDSQVVASERAEKDAKEVEAYLNLTRKMCRRLSC